MSRYLSIDATLVRLIAVILALSNGIGVILYLVLWIIVESVRRERTTTTSSRRHSRHRLPSKPNMGHVTTPYG
ncbi:MAG: PspC domain-containing protein [Chloroflexi bacterium]|nr:PspC domain-containing protein [Chloroflexota bacterium]